MSDYNPGGPRVIIPLDSVVYFVVLSECDLYNDTAFHPLLIINKRGYDTVRNFRQVGHCF